MARRHHRHQHDEVRVRRRVGSGDGRASARLLFFFELSARLFAGPGAAESCFGADMEIGTSRLDGYAGVVEISTAWARNLYLQLGDLELDLGPIILGWRMPW